MPSKYKTLSRYKIIHKRNNSKYNVATDVLCGRFAKYSKTSYTWNKVTCKNCLIKGINYE